MNKHLTQAIAKYEANQVNFQNIFHWHLCYGIVLCDDDCFAMGFYSDSEEPDQAVEKHHSDTLFCTYCAGDMRKALRAFIDDSLQYLAFQRSFQNSDRIRLFDISSFYSKLP